MFLDLLETADESDRGWLCPHMRSLCICRDVSLMNVSAYTQPTYMQGTAELINNDRIYKACSTSLRTFISAQK
jgi:hypothetical protein